MVVSKKDIPRCELLIGDIRIKQVQTFTNLGSFITDNGICDTETQYIWIKKDDIQKLYKVQDASEIPPQIPPT